MTASRFAVTAILARRLGTEVFGQYAYSQWLIDIGFLVCTLGATGVASRYFAEYRHQPAMLVTMIREWRPFAIALPVVGALVSGAAAWQTGLRYDAASFVLLMCWAVASGLWGMRTAALTGLQRFDLIFVANLLAAVIMLIGAAFVPIAEGSPGSVFAVMAAATAIGGLIGVRSIAAAARGVPAPLDGTQRRVIYAYAINIWLTALLWNLVWSRGEVPVIRGLLGDEAVAHYAVALTIYGGAVAGVMLGIGGMAPQITRYLGEGKEAAAISLCRTAMDLQLLLSGLGALALIWLAPELMYLGFGERYRDSAALLGVLALGLPALSVASHNHLLQMITGARYNRNTTLLGVVLLLGSAWAGVSALGLAGAAWSRAATLLALGGITLFVCRRRWGPVAVGVANPGLVTGVAALSVLCHALPVFETLPIRMAAWLTLSLFMLALVRNQANELVAPYLANLLWRRVRAGN